MGTRPTAPARRNSLENELMPKAFQGLGLLNDDFASSKSATPGSLPSAPSITSSRNTSPNRSDGYASDDQESRTSSPIDDLLVEIFGENSKEEHAFYQAPHTAHITKQSLAELDIGSIINNSKLRHDVNFDRELHFRPNMDGERGRRKQNAQHLYWRGVSTELHIVFHVLTSNMSEASKATVIPQCTSRLRQMFETIKEILKNLVPDRDQSDVDEKLDVKLLMQQISRGILNFVSTAGWIAQLLKRHCAPMRDEMVDKMVEKIQKQTPDSITDGLVSLFNVLEAMKLDVANHQIRHLRALLIEDTVNFEKKYHVSRMRKHKYDCRSARKWFTSVRDNPAPVQTLGTETVVNRDVGAFVKGFFDLLLPTTTRLPDTFALDGDRIRGLRADIDECIRERICCDVLKELVSRRNSTLSEEQETQFRQRLQMITGDARTSIWHVRGIEDISCEIVRFTLQVTGSDEEIDAELEDTASEMLNALLWALSCARTDSMPEIGEADDREKINTKYGKQLSGKLFDKVLCTVQEYLTSSPYDIFLALVPPPAPPPLCPTPTSMRPTDREQDLVRRIAHIAILHWRTWEHLVYNNEDLDRDAEDSESEAASRTSTPGPGGHASALPAIPTGTRSAAPRDDGMEPSGEGCPPTKALA